MGIPLYGRAFENTNGIGSSYSGIGPGTIEAGVYSYKALPLAGAQVYENLTDVTSYSYDSSKRELVTYDTPNIASIKAQYVRDKGLAGSMFWELSTDKTGSDSLVTTTANVYGSLDQTQNHINFPNSKWDNLRSNMGQSTGGSSSSKLIHVPELVYVTELNNIVLSLLDEFYPYLDHTYQHQPLFDYPEVYHFHFLSPLVVDHPAVTTPTGGSSSGACVGVSAWGSSTTYTGGNKATYNGHLWTAKWWSYNDTPGGPAGVWTDNGNC
ncbi:hypothetical protein VTO73DRAFT_7059 [Trametes versicolor]